MARLLGIFSWFGERKEDLLTARGLISLLSWTCAFSAAWLAFRSGEILVEAEKVDFPPLAKELPTAAGPQKAMGPVESYRVILTRNLFNAGAPATSGNTGPVSAARPKLRLVGTNAKAGKDSFAIIEDLNKNEQDVFNLQDAVFTYGKLIEVNPENVRLQYADRVDTLQLEEGGAAPTAGTPEGAGSSGDGTEFTVAESEVTEALANLPLLLSQARAVPYFRNGQSIGMRLFAIRYGSLYEKLGLKNGDIVLAVNDNSLSDPSQALKLFEQLKSERSVSVKLERNGDVKDLHYAIR